MRGRAPRPPRLHPRSYNVSCGWQPTDFSSALCFLYTTSRISDVPAITSSSVSMAPSASATTIWTTVVQTTVVIVPPASGTSFLSISTSSASTSLDNTGGFTSNAVVHSDTTRSVTSATLPLIITGGPSFTSLPSIVTASTSTTSGAIAASATAAPAVTQKQAIIGGLSGAVAGFLLIGLLIFFCLRRRRRKRDTCDNEKLSLFSEHGFRPAVIRKWSELSLPFTRSPQKQTHPAFRDRAPVIDDNVIRVSLDQWHRPFVGNEGMRDSMPPSRLQVTNPDPSAQSTPYSTAGGSYFFQRQKDAIEAVFYRDRSRQNLQLQHTGFHELPVPAPTILIDPALSREGVMVVDRTPSFRSYPSVSSLPVVRQQPPEDPFRVPADNGRNTAPAPPPHRRPVLAPLQSLQRSDNHLSPLRMRSNQPRTTTARAVSADSSISSVPSSWSSTRTWSDQFDLDKAGPAGQPAPLQREYPMSHLHVYEGT